VKDYRQLRVWQRSHALAIACYRLSQSFPRHELFGLTGQLRRAGASVPANIAEGCGRGGDAEFKRFLNIALGSACETDYFILLAHELGYLDDAGWESLAKEALELRKMLGALIQKLQA
jgi:four helix bundle protein